MLNHYRALKLFSSAHSVRPLLLIFFSAIVFFSVSQQPGINKNLVFEQYEEADHYYHLALSSGKLSEAEEERLNQTALEKFRLFLSNFSKDLGADSLIFFAFSKLGELEHYFDQLHQALTHYNTAIELKKQLPSVSDSFLFKPYIFGGLIYYRQNKLDSAFTYFKNAEAVQSHFTQKLQESERLYNNLGGIYYEYGNYRQAKNYFQKALDILSKDNPSYEALYVNYNINLGTILFKLEDYDGANSIYQKLLSKGIYLNQIYNNIGLINFYLGAPKQAIQYFKKVNYSNALSIGLYNDIANAYFNLEEFDSVKKYLHLAEENNKLYNSSGQSIDYGRTLKLYGDLAKTSGSYVKALQFYQQAFHQFYPSFGSDSVESNPDKFSGAFSYINLFHALLAKAETFHELYVQSGLLKWGQEELETYAAAFHLIDYVERTYESDEARLFIERTKYLVHTKPIDIAYELYLKTKDKKFVESLYVFDQQNKASILALNGQMREQLSFKDSSVITKERLIKTEITKLSLQAAGLKNDTELVKINKQIRDKEIELGKIQEQVSGTVTGSKIPSIPFLQHQLLDPKTALISYHLSEDNLFATLITKNKIECFRQTLFQNFHDVISKYIDRLRQPSVSDHSIKTSSGIYNFFFQQLDLKNIERLIIIPDDELNYLSFESLQDSSGTYLIQKYSVQYQYSTSLLKKESINFSGHETLAFAPFVSNSYQDSTIQFQQLSNSLKEINNLKGKKFTDSTATKTNFLNALSQYKVVHLATHAVVNSKEDNLSYISFYPSANKNHSDFLLYSEEIYNLPLNKTNLVILSACETASGNLVKGEGVMSLSRAFAYAGCPNIITSLWNANDFSTAYLTSKVHVYLDKNYSIDEALRQSKLDYLNDKSINPRLKDPFYWSHLIFVGNYSPAKTLNYWWIAILALGIIAAILFLLKLNRPR